MHETFTYNLPIRIYGNETENSITFRMKRGSYRKPEMPETIKLLRSTESKILKIKIVIMCFV